MLCLAPTNMQAPTFPTPLSLAPIGTIHTCFPDKFGVPRQPGLVPLAHGVIRLNNDPELRQALQGLTGFSHLWIIFLFHKHDAKKWKPTVRPPRLGGAKKIGVLASRSPHRPNPIGLSAVKIISIDEHAPLGPEITVEGVDLLNGTPVLDIKPYLPYTDSIPHALSGWAKEPIVKHPVQWTDGALAQLSAPILTHPHFKELAEQLLALDPRPAFQQRRAPLNDPTQDGAPYGMALYNYDVKWHVEKGQIIIDGVVSL